MLDGSDLKTTFDASVRSGEFLSLSLWYQGRGNGIRKVKKGEILSLTWEECDQLLQDERCFESRRIEVAGPTSRGCCSRNEVRPPDDKIFHAFCEKSGHRMKVFSRPTPQMGAMQ